MRNEKELKFIDLCCGIGGFHEALSNMGMRCVLASDIDEACRKNYELNYKLRPKGDLTKLDVKKIPGFDVLCAGFPCQPFSKAGDQKGFDDNRGNIFFEICKIIEYHKPKYLILENVRNFASHDKGHTWDVIRRKIDELNYYTYENPVILNTLYFGIPQSRERVVILCKRKDLGELEKLPKISKENIKETNLKSILEEDADNKYNINGKMKVTEEVWNEFLNICNTNKIDIPRFPIWTDWWDKDRNEDIITYKKYTNWIDKNQEFYVTNKKLLERWLEVSRGKKLWQGAVRKMEWQTGENNLNMREVLWSARGSGVRIKKCNYSPTLVAMGSMIPIYGPESRFLTKRECARLQSFPDDYIIDEKNAYKQFGNAVNVVMIERAARFMIKGEDLLI
jgi:DNA (cytosine-5)-methyltransferase 1